MSSECFRAPEAGGLPPRLELAGDSSAVLDALPAGERPFKHSWFGITSLVIGIIWAHLNLSVFITSLLVYDNPSNGVNYDLFSWIFLAGLLTITVVAPLIGVILGLVGALLQARTQFVAWLGIAIGGINVVLGLIATTLIGIELFR